METLTPPPIQNAIAEQPGLLTPRVWSRYFDAVRSHVLALEQQGGTPGPPGPQGEQGEPGPPGPAGADATLGPTLTTIEALTGTANTMLYFTGTDVAALTALSAYARTLLDDADQATARGTLGIGTIAVQNANAVVLTDTTVMNNVGLGQLHIGAAYAADNCFVKLRWTHQTHFGMRCQPTDNDTGAGHPLEFKNLAGTTIGSIATTASATAFNTSSDMRLKEQVEALPGGLATIEALSPVQFRWKADGSLGHGLIAQEVQAVVPGVVTGAADAVDGDGQMLPQQIDYSKLVPWLIAGMQELAARLAALEGAPRG